MVNDLSAHKRNYLFWVNHKRVDDQNRPISMIPSKSIHDAFLLAAELSAFSESLYQIIFNFRR